VFYCGPPHPNIIEDTEQALTTQRPLHLTQAERAATFLPAITAASTVVQRIEVVHVLSGLLGDTIQNLPGETVDVGGISRRFQFSKRGPQKSSRKGEPTEFDGG
jgi:hypothetical protein